MYDCNCKCNCKNKNKYDYMCLTPSITKTTVIDSTNNKIISKYTVNCNHFASCYLTKTSCKK